LLPPLRSHQAAAQSAALLVYVVNLDIVPANFDRFMDAAKANAVASMKGVQITSLSHIGSWSLQPGTFSRE
jgi:hypothetical protein